MAIEVMRPQHCLHRAGDLCGEKTTALSTPLRTSQVWFGSLTGMEQSWLRPPLLRVPQKSYQS